MPAAAFTLPLDQVINVVTLTQCLIFAGFFWGRPAQTEISTWFLIASFLILAAVKADQIYQGLGGFRAYPQYGFVLTPVQAAMTQALYLFVVARTTESFKLRRRHLWHLTPALLVTVYLTATYYRLDLSDKIALVESGGLNTVANRLIVPLIGDGVQLAYLIAAYRRLEQFGVSLKEWFARVENRNLVWLKRLLTAWCAIFLIHAAFTVTAAAPAMRAAAIIIVSALDLAHLLIANVLALMGAADLERRFAGLEAFPRSVSTPQEPEKYAASGLTSADRAALYDRAREALHEKALYLQPDLTLRDLAAAIGAPPRDVSEAVNGAGAQSFFEFVNLARVAHAQALLLREPQTRILDIAFRSGFNSKSAFNETFKKSAGVTPSEFRRGRDSSQKTGRSAENPAPGTS